tara:strand:+ start:444 stop:656 length:213 start_codon:yes stop_codon:yes gene_type:complete
MAKASTRGRKPFKRKVTTITKELPKQIDLEDLIAEVEIVIERGVLNHNFVAKKYNISIEEAKDLVKKANK